MVKRVIGPAILLLCVWSGCPSGGQPADLSPALDQGGAAQDLPAAPDLPANACVAEQPCSGPLRCLAPLESPGCGTCRRPDPMELCQRDAECKARGATLICQPGVCVCSGESVCVAGCTGPAECPEGTLCSAGNRCEPRPCALPQDCPASFRCTAVDGGAGARCERRPCQRSSECSGYCVKGLCYDTPGTCSAPPP